MAKKSKQRSSKHVQSVRSTLTTNLGSLSHADIQAELRRRERRVKTLERRRDRLLGKAAEVERQIQEHGGRTQAGTLRHRPRNEAPLHEALRALLKGKQMSVTEAAVAVQKAGHVTNSPNFRTMVNIVLLNKENFTRVARGVYTAK